MNSYYRVTIQLDQMTPEPPDDKGYRRQDHADRLSEVTLTGGTEGNVLRQAHQHVGILVSTYTPVAVKDVGA